jgi:hypothetical protein
MTHWRRQFGKARFRRASKRDSRNREAVHPPNQLHIRERVHALSAPRPVGRGYTVAPLPGAKRMRADAGQLFDLGDAEALSCTSVHKCEVSSKLSNLSIIV